MEDTPTFRNYEGTQFSIIISTRITLDRAIPYRTKQGKRSLIVEDTSLTPDNADETVLLDHNGYPRFLYFADEGLIQEIKAVVLNREELHSTFGEIRDSTRGTVFLKKSRMIPSHDVYG